MKPPWVRPWVCRGSAPAKRLVSPWVCRGSVVGPLCKGNQYDSPYIQPVANDEGDTNEEEAMSAINRPMREGM